MAIKPTLPYPDEQNLVPVRTLAVEIVEGPDAGARATAESETLTVGSADGNDLVLSDSTVSRYHLQLERCDEGVLLRDLGSTNGSFAAGIRVREAFLSPGTKVKAGRTVLQVQDGKPRPVDYHPEDRLGELRGRTTAMRRLFARLRKVAASEAPVLVIGESGTGKELIARAIHDFSNRSQAPFVTVDCGSLAPNLVASELFGHERGAFTGAERQHVGAFERASGGTLFLDEIGELPRDLQPNLLGALERRRLRRVGGKTDIDVDVRIVAATNRDLRIEVNEGTFRLDLYYRLAVVTLAVPPLRERRDDVPLLMKHFLEDMGHDDDITTSFPADYMTSLHAHHWPGNVRELRNLVEATVAMGELPDLGTGMPSEPPVEASADPAGPSGGFIPLQRVLPASYKEARAAVMADFEREYVRYWLTEADGNVAQAARSARMDRSHMFHLIKRHRLKSS